MREPICVLFCLLGFVENLYAMQVFVKLETAKTITLDVEPSDSIESIKSKIEDKEGILPEKQRLIFNSITLENDKTLADYSISEGTMLSLFVVIPVSASIGLDLSEKSTIFATEIEVK